jgi:hypothetical protein
VTDRKPGVTLGLGGVLNFNSFTSSASSDASLRLPLSLPSSSSEATELPDADSSPPSSGGTQPSGFQLYPWSNLHFFAGPELFRRFFRTSGSSGKSTVKVLENGHGVRSKNKTFRKVSLHFSTACKSSSLSPGSSIR